jgi:hypothetical protein
VKSSASESLHDDDIVEATVTDRRSVQRRLLAPISVAIAGLAGCAVVFAVDPNEPGHYPLCPTRALLGIDCPGCGLMRGTYDLLHGDLAGAVDHNLLIPFLVPIVLVLWLGWLKRAGTGIRPAVTRGQFRRRNRLLLTGLALLLAFGVVRNFVPYLDSGSSAAPRSMTISGSAFG